MNPRRFLIWWACATLFACLCGASINIVVDPYGLWDMPRQDGFNAVKPQAPSRSRIVKPSILLEVNPATVVVGNSRPEMGIDPNDECWPESAKPVFNLTRPGSSVEEQLILATHAIVGTDAKSIYLGVDYSDFISARFGTRQTFAPPQRFVGSERLLRENFYDANSKRLQTLIKDRVAASFSLIALKDSVLTVLKQRTPYADNMTREGFYNAGAFATAVSQEGQRVLFEQKMPFIEQTFTPGKSSAFWPGEATSPRLLLLDSFLTFALVNDVNVTLFINPLHADFLDVMDDSGYWQEFEQWKRALAVLADKHGSALWDFSDYDEFSTGTDKTDTPPYALRWFWEPSHYTAKLGSRMIASFNGACRDPSPGFGAKVDPNSIEQRLTNVRTHKALYHARRATANAP